MNLGDSDCGWGKRQESSSIGPRLVSFYREQGRDALLMGNRAWPEFLLDSGALAVWDWNSLARHPRY